MLLNFFHSYSDFCSVHYHWVLLICWFHPVIFFDMYIIFVALFFMYKIKRTNHKLKESNNFFFFFLFIFLMEYIIGINYTFMKNIDENGQYYDVTCLFRKPIQDFLSTRSEDYPSTRVPILLLVAIPNIYT